MHLSTCRDTEDLTGIDGFSNFSNFPDHTSPPKVWILLNPAWFQVCRYIFFTSTRDAIEVFII